MGVYSYTIYLTHFVVLHYLMPEATPKLFPIAFLIAFSISFHPRGCDAQVCRPACGDAASVTREHEWICDLERQIDEPCATAESLERKLICLYMRASDKPPARRPERGVSVASFVHAP